MNLFRLFHGPSQAAAGFAKKYGVTVHVRSTFKAEEGTMVAAGDPLLTFAGSAAPTGNVLRFIVADTSDGILDSGAIALDTVTTVDLGPALERLAGVELVAATDVAGGRRCSDNDDNKARGNSL